MHPAGTLHVFMGKIRSRSLQGRGYLASSIFPDLAFFTARQSVREQYFFGSRLFYCSPACLRAVLSTGLAFSTARPGAPRRKKQEPRTSPQLLFSLSLILFSANSKSYVSLRASIQCQSSILPSTEMVTTCHWMNFPLALSAFSAAICSPPQQGTSMRRMVTLLMSLSLMIPVSFSE